MRKILATSSIPLACVAGAIPASERAAHFGPLWVRLTGPAGTRAFLDAELPALAST